MPHSDGLHREVATCSATCSWCLQPRWSSASTRQHQIHLSYLLLIEIYDWSAEDYSFVQSSRENWVENLMRSIWSECTVEHSWGVHTQWEVALAVSSSSKSTNLSPPAVSANAKSGVVRECGAFWLSKSVHAHELRARWFPSPHFILFFSLYLLFCIGLEASSFPLSTHGISDSERCPLNCNEIIKSQAVWQRKTPFNSTSSQNNNAFIEGKNCRCRLDVSSALLTARSLKNSHLNSEWPAKQPHCPTTNALFLSPRFEEESIAVLFP